MRLEFINAIIFSILKYSNFLLAWLYTTSNPYVQAVYEALLRKLTEVRITSYDCLTTFLCLSRIKTIYRKRKREIVLFGNCGYDLIARGYRRKVWDVIFIVSRVTPRGKGVVVDAGCGPGHNTLALLEHGLFYKALCLDISFNMVHKAVTCAGDFTGSGRFQGVCSDMSAMPLRDSVADAVLMVASLHHLIDHASRIRALRESFRVLKTGGAVLVVVWARWQARLLPLLLKGVARYVLRRSESPWDVVKCSRGGAVCREYHLYSLGELISDVRGAGFKVVEAGTYVAPGRKSLPRKNYYVVGVKPRVNSK